MMRGRIPIRKLDERRKGEAKEFLKVAVSEAPETRSLAQAIRRHIQPLGGVQTAPGAVWSAYPADYAGTSRVFRRAGLSSCTRALRCFGWFRAVPVEVAPLPLYSATC
jgi:hypothetical protein